MDYYDMRAMTDGLMRVADRRDFLYLHVPHCALCKSEQVQLVDQTNKPAQWRCRICHYHFAHEPMTA